MTLDITDLTSKQAAAQIQKMLDQHQVARADVDAAQRKAAAIRKMIEAVVELYPEHEDLLPEDLDGEHVRPRGAEAVRRVLTSTNSEWHTVAGIVGLLSQAGWMPESSNPANAVRTAAERLVDRRTLEKNRTADGSVIYRVPPYDPAEEPF